MGCWDENVDLEERVEEYEEAERYYSDLLKKWKSFIIGIYGEVVEKLIDEEVEFVKVKNLGIREDWWRECIECKVRSRIVSGWVRDLKRMN